MLKEIQSRYGYLDKATVSSCKQNKYQKECDFLHLGHLCHTVWELSLDNDETWEGDMNELAEHLSRLPQASVPQHSDCGWVQQLQTEVEACLLHESELKLSDFSSRIEIIDRRSMLEKVVIMEKHPSLYRNN
jgi:hypothetical protein